MKSAKHWIWDHEEEGHQSQVCVIFHQSGIMSFSVIFVVVVVALLFSSFRSHNKFCATFLFDNDQ